MSLSQPARTFVQPSLCGHPAHSLLFGSEKHEFRFVLLDCAGGVPVASAYSKYYIYRLHVVLMLLPALGNAGGNVRILIGAVKNYRLITTTL